MIELEDAPTTETVAGHAACVKTAAGHDRVRLILVDPDAMSRHALSDALRADGRFTVIAQAESSNEGVELALHYKPALVVIANAVPGMDAVRAIERITAGAAEVLSREMTRLLLDRLRRTPEDGSGMRPVKSPLTDREWEILDMICSGMGTREMADDLFLSTETVNSHVKRILRKLGVHSRSAAVEVAGQMRSGILV